MQICRFDRSKLEKPKVKKKENGKENAMKTGIKIIDFGTSMFSN